LKTQKITQNALTGSAHRPREKGEKRKKNISRFFAEKTVFACLASDRAAGPQRHLDPSEGLSKCQQIREKSKATKQGPKQASGYSII
jgi:hypothetical protein